VDGIRASDAEREQTAERLRTACLEGRLEADELDERLAAAFRARTRGELSALVGDLPGQRPVVLLPGRPVRGRGLPAGTIALRTVLAIATLALLAALVLPGDAWMMIALSALAIGGSLLLLVLMFAPVVAVLGAIAWVARRLAGPLRRQVFAPPPHAPRGPETPWS